MQIEYEAKFPDVNKEEVRKKLESIGAVCVKKEVLQKRVVFNLPGEKNVYGTYARVRDEGDKITTSIKIISGDKIEDQKELCLTIDNFDTAIEYLKFLGCEQKAYQENLREKWIYENEVEVTIDTWPFLETFIEVEGSSEERVKDVSEKLGFNYDNAIFGATDTLIQKKYGISPERINQETPVIIFDMENPFL